CLAAPEHFGIAYNIFSGENLYFIKSRHSPIDEFFCLFLALLNSCKSTHCQKQTPAVFCCRTYKRIARIFGVTRSQSVCTNIARKKWISIALENLIPCEIRLRVKFIEFRIGRVDMLCKSKQIRQSDGLSWCW